MCRSDGSPALVTVTDALNGVTRYGDGDGVRVGRIKTAENAEVAEYLFDRNFGLSQLLYETDGATGTFAYSRDAHGLLLSQTRATDTTYYAFDHLGTTRALTNASQSVTDTYVDDAWGNEVVTQGSTANAFRYVGMLGYYWDADTGLMLLGVRWYAASAARFLSPDPLWDTNLYWYARNAPSLYFDPDGMKATGGKAKDKDDPEKKWKCSDDPPKKCRNVPYLGAYLQRTYCSECHIECYDQCDKLHNGNAGYDYGPAYEKCIAACDKCWEKCNLKPGNTF